MNFREKEILLEVAGVQTVVTIAKEEIGKVVARLAPMVIRGTVVDQMENERDQGGPDSHKKKRIIMDPKIGQRTIM